MRPAGAPGLACYAGSVRARGGARCIAFAGAIAMAAACGDDDSASTAPDASLADAAHRGDTGPIGGPVHDADVICESMGLLGDDFDDLSSERWLEFRDPVSSACTVAVADGRLEVASAAATVACGLVSARCHDFSDRAIMIDAVAPGDDGVPQPFFRLALDGGGSVEMRVAAGAPLSLEVLRDGEVQASAPFDPAAHRLWRMMHTEVAGRIDCQTAPLGTSDWTTLGSTQVVHRETTEVQVLVGVSNAGAPDDVIAFDDLVGIDF